MPKINPEILRWARETAGLDLVAAAARIGLNDARGVAGAQRLEALEAGDSEPSAALLKRISAQYRRPLLTFFLPKAPKRDDVGEDFRTLPARHDPSNTTLDALLRDVKARQSLVREYLEDDDDADPVKFIGSRRQADGVAKVADAIAEDIGFDRAHFRAARSSEEAFAYLRDCAQQAGIFVLLAGDLGSWQTAIDVSVFRGFALADTVAPFVVVNDQDAQTAWSFTLLHELAHLWIGKSGVSGAAPTPGAERFCNDVAAAVLVNSTEITTLPVSDNTPADEARALIRALAASLRISSTMVVYQLFREQRITDQTRDSLTNHFYGAWLEGRQARREAAHSAESGPSYYVVRRHRIGNALIDIARRGLAEGSITPVRAAKILGVKPMMVYQVIADPNRRGRAA
jgi:Zn-dependent peptidase ImmA (M78 family)